MRFTSKLVMIYIIYLFILILTSKYNSLRNLFMFSYVHVMFAFEPFSEGFTFCTRVYVIWLCYVLNLIDIKKNLKPIYWVNYILLSNKKGTMPIKHVVKGFFNHYITVFDCLVRIRRCGMIANRYTLSTRDKIK